MYAVAPLKQVGRGLKLIFPPSDYIELLVAPLKQVGRGLKQ